MLETISLTGISLPNDLLHHRRSGSLSFGPFKGFGDILITANVRTVIFKLRDCVKDTVTGFNLLRTVDKCVQVL